MEMEKKIQKNFFVHTRPAMVMRCWFLRKYYYLYIFIFCEKCFNLLRVKLVYVKVVEPVVLEAGAGVAIEDNIMFKFEKYISGLSLGFHLVSLAIIALGR